jgi:hypothetical protein
MSVKKQELQRKEKTRVNGAICWELVFYSFPTWGACLEVVFEFK